MPKRCILRIEPKDYYPQSQIDDVLGKYPGLRPVSKLGLTWEVPDPISLSFYWEVNAEPLVKLADIIRKELNKLSIMYRDAWYSHKDVDKNQANEHLKRTAQLGIALHSIVFGSESKEMKEYLESNEWQDSPFEVIVRARPTIDFSIPWGLIFDPHAEGGYNPQTDKHFQAGFWCLRRRLATIFQNPNLFHPQHSEHDDSSMVSILSKDVLDELRVSTKGWPRHSHFFLFDDLIGKEHDKKDRVLYFFCHANDNKLKIPNKIWDNEPIGYNEFKYYASHVPKNICEVLVFNACNSSFIAEGHWLDAVWVNGLRGFIGSEAEVPAPFAWEFGLDFLRNFISDQVPSDRISNILFKLRIKHWPLGLLYGLFADPDIFFPRRARIPHIQQIPDNWCEKLIKGI